MNKITLIDPKMDLIQPLPSPTYYPSATLTKPIDYPGVFLLELHALPDNRLTKDFIEATVSSDLQNHFLDAGH